MFSLLFCCICMSLAAIVSNHSILFANAGLQCGLFLGCLAWKWVLPVWWICSIECWPTALFCQNLNQPRFAILLQKAIQWIARLFLKPICRPPSPIQWYQTVVFDTEPNQPLYTQNALLSLLDIEVFEVLCSMCSKFYVFVFIFLTNNKRVLVQNVRLGWPEW